jgi:tetratricopeptide (TPR) repeat protein
LGTALRDGGDLLGAWAQYDRALALFKATYGDFHPQVAIALNNLGAILKDLGDVSEARLCFERALEIFEQFFGKDHELSVGTRRNLELL